MKKLMLLLMLCLLPSALVAQQGQGRKQGESGQRRQELEVQVVQRFLDHAARELRLSPPDRTRLEEHLRESAPRRRALAQQTTQLRMQLMRAVRDSTTADAQFTRMINEMTRLRDQEEAQWKADQEALGRILSPRQHARFLMLWMRFNDQIRDMAARRPRGR